MQIDLENINREQIEQVELVFQNKYKADLQVYYSLSDECLNLIDEFINSLSIPFIEHEREGFFPYSDEVLNEYNDLINLHRKLEALFNHPLWKALIKVKPAKE